jgi:peptidoglycan/LPS O-acetylase OafA/YrhL
MPSLDGLRAFSIALVLAAHLRWFPDGPLRGAFEMGELGVRIFFVISGFLITRLLLEERLRSGTIGLGDFYLRRAFRIVPAYLVFLLAVVGLRALHVLTLRPGDLAAALTYTMNYHPQRSWYVGHTWSLSVEEQFYLLWPAVLLLLGPRRGLVVAGLGLVVAPLLRVATWVWAPAQHASIGESFHTVFDSIATGCLLAGLGSWLDQRPRYLAFLRSRWFYLALPAIYLTHAVAGYITFDYPIGQTVRNLAIALCIDRWVRYPDDRIGRALNHPTVAGLGRMSYSLYLWQQLFLSPHPMWPALPFPVNLACALGLAFCSYRLIEQPCQQYYRQRRAQRRPQPAPLQAHKTLPGVGPSYSWRMTTASHGLVPPP